MKSIVFDTGPIISLALNNLLWILKPLKEKFKGNFCICPSAKRELVDTPLQTKRFKFEALQIMKLIRDGVLTVSSEKNLTSKTNALLNLANNTFSAHGKSLRIVQQADMEGIACSELLGASAYVVDERTTRALIENQKRLKAVLKNKLRSRITVNTKNLQKFSQESKQIKIIRSVELVTIAFELGLLNQYLANIPEPKKTLLDGLLWGLKLNGCTVSKREINQLIKEEK